ncbi:MAG: winged helix-turn-helix domain-containing protein [Gemmatimonadaceae bacterium]
MAYILLIDDEAAITKSAEGEAAVQTPFAVSGNLALLRDTAPPPPDPVILYLVLPDENAERPEARALVNRVDPSGALRPLNPDETEGQGGTGGAGNEAPAGELGVPRLLARVEALLRQATKGSRAEIDARTEAIGDVEVNLLARSVTKGGEAVDLAPVEFDLLVVLLRHRGRIVSRRQLVREVWHDRVAVTSRTLDKHVYKLRRKLENNPANPRYLRTVTGAGYRLEL